MHEARHSAWRNSAPIKAPYPSASVLSSRRVVFEICGNKYSLVVAVNYAYQTLYIRLFTDLVGNRKVRKLFTIHEAERP